MKKTPLTLILLSLSILSFGQGSENQKLIELGKAYKDFMFRNEAPKEAIKDLESGMPKTLKLTAEFIIQTINTKNKLLTQQYLARPENKALKQIFIVKAINLNLRNENQIDNNKLIDSIYNKEIPAYELLDNYYGMLFTAVGNKNQPFDLSGADLRIKDYNLKDDTEKGILVLRAMDLCASTIWGFMNVVKPANTQKALENIKKFPRINGMLYYQYTDFYFPDFEMNIIKDKGLQSYKGHYLNKFYETLIYHVICLGNEGANQEEKNNLLLGSILKERNLYKYTKYKETLENTFKEQKRD